MASALGSAQSPSFMGPPAGVNHWSAAPAAPDRKRPRRKTGCARRNAIRRRANASSSLSALAQSSQVISLSWQ